MKVGVRCIEAKTLSLQLTYLFLYVSSPQSIFAVIAIILTVIFFLTLLD